RPVGERGARAPPGQPRPSGRLSPEHGRAAPHLGRAGQGGIMTEVRDGSPGASATAQSGQPGGNGASAGDALLTVTGLTKHFPVVRGIIFRNAVGLVTDVDVVSFYVVPDVSLLVSI